MPADLEARRRRTSRPRSAATLLAAALLVAAGLVAPLAAPAAAGPTATGVRVAGPDRYATAAEVARQSHPTGAATALLATGEGFADAVASAALAAAVDGPVLLTRPDSLPVATRDVLAELRVGSVLVLGGPVAVSDAVVADLSGEGYAVERVAGPDRFATAAEVARRAAALRPLHVVDGRPAVLVTTGTLFPDALTAGAPAARLGMPTVLVPEAAVPPVPVAVEAALADLGVRHAVLVGGTTVLPEAVADRLRALGITVERVAGPIRTVTAVEVSERFVAPGVLDSGTVVLVRGDDPADALAAGPYAAGLDAPVLLAPEPTVLGVATGDHLEFRTRVGPPVTEVRVVGGPAAVAPDVMAEAVARTDSDGDGVPDVAVEPPAPLVVPRGQALPVAAFAVPGNGSWDLALFPCGLVSTAGPHVFSDPAADRSADGLAVTDTGRAAITRVNGEDRIVMRLVRDVRPGPVQPEITWTVSSPGADCAVAILWLDVDGDGQLTVDAAARAVEPYGLSVLRWGAAGLPAFGPPDVRQHVGGSTDGFVGLVDVRVGRNAGFDRVVLEFDGGSGTPGWFAQWDEDPRFDGSGFPVDVEGATALVVGVTGLSIPGDMGTPAYSGPDRLDGPGVSVLEVVVGGVFEGQWDVFSGAPERRPFRVFSLDSPRRVVIDVQH